MNTVFTIGIFLCFFLQFLLLSKKQASISDRILGVWMFFIGLHLFSYYLYYLGYWDRYPHLSGIHHPFPLLHGPFLYLYVLFSLKSDQRLRWRDYLHFSPALLFYVYMIPFLFFYSAEEKLMVNHGEVDDYAGFIVFSLFAFFASGLGYAIASYRMLSRHEHLTSQNFAYSESIDMGWLKYFIWGIGMIFLVTAVVILFEWSMGVNFGFNTDLVLYVPLVGFILFLGYSGIRQKNIFADGTSQIPQIVEPKLPGEYVRSGLKTELAQQYHQKLLDYMSANKPYLEPKLSLGHLARELDISANHLSQIINQYEEKNFFDFVNTYRVNEFKQRVADPANSSYSILAIALDSGFNSKSSFNQVFKKVSGKTPSQHISGA
ncbi:AraC family transcriptional regulator [Natronogracilivirga saccharolytica]|uniref:AraC family transcriptional regulator n=1 Tax=Natronogracilivirga saccharolytica TaxID=2812953 RepID=A0A8J7UUU8_9BACT|nr:helix-turn-helix domain-containing protein [Natronogracilivirga saccharolytica]MBP3191851.1 AraC family transcriptional regulator [Natronogracilivirga saccharolytica]